MYRIPISTANRFSWGYRSRPDLLSSQPLYHQRNRPVFASENEVGKMSQEGLPDGWPEIDVRKGCPRRMMVMASVKKTPVKKTKKATAKKAAKSTAKKAPAKKSTAKKAVKASAKKAAKSPAKKSPAKKVVAKKASAKKAVKASAKKATAKKAPAKKAPAKNVARAAVTKSSAPVAPPKKAPTVATKAPAKPEPKPAFVKPPVPGKKAVSKDGIIANKDFDLNYLRAQRELLLEQKARLMGQAERLDTEREKLIEEAGMGDDQFDEDGGEGDTMAVERERDRVLSDQARQTVEEIDAALNRIETGDYGYSIVSTRPIPRERLEVIPWATELVEERVGWIGRR